MSSDIQSTFIDPAAADPNGLSTTAAVGDNAAVILNGALTSGGVGTFDIPRNVTILSSGDDSSISFLVVGTDETETAVSESVTGANADTAVTSAYFSTITAITAVGDPAANVTAGSGTAIAAPMFRGRMRLNGLYAVNTATAGTITFRETSATGGIRMQFNTVAAANTTEYPDVPDDGILFVGGGYVLYTLAAMSSLTVFYC
jgi:VCBS repeat-containing protein